MRTAFALPGSKLQEIDAVDELETVAYEHETAIRKLYQQFVDRHPVMLYDVQEQRVYAYPYLEFKRELSQRSQELLKEQYDQAGHQNQMVVFVRDNRQRRLISFLWKLEV